MEEELTIVIAAALTYLGLPPERLDISELPVRTVVSGLRLQASKQFRMATGHAWKWSLSSLQKSNLPQGRISLKQRASTWRQVGIF